MSYESKMEICRSIRRLEYDSSGVERVKKDIAASTGFTGDEKDFLYFCADRFVASHETKQDLSKTIMGILPYGLAAAAGYGARLVQEKIGEYVEEGKIKAREEFAKEGAKEGQLIKIFS